MDKRSLAYAGYWRNSLADAEYGRGGLSWKDAAPFRRVPKWELARGQVNREVVEACFAGEQISVELVAVLVRPHVYLPRLEHGQWRRDGVPEIVSPIVIHAHLARDGRIYPTDDAVVPRDLLEPLERGSFAIGGMAEQDAYLTKSPLAGFDPPDGEAEEARHAERWADYLAACDGLLVAVAPEWPTEEDGVERSDFGFLVKEESTGGVSRHILPLYDHIRAHAPSAPLFDRFACASVVRPEPCLSANAAFSLRLGHGGDRFPLAEAQRDALAHLMVAEEGEILAVNGPPGTGKTTLLLSVVASLWARAALEGGEPPVIVAASTNNQAVTNVIDAFGRDFSAGTGPFAGRWLPEISSFGAYYPSVARERELRGKYQTRAFFERVESEEYVAEAERAYLKAAAAAFPAMERPTVGSVVAALREAIRAEEGKLLAIERAWQRLEVARAAIHGELGEDPAGVVAERKSRLEEVKTERAALRTAADGWERYLAEEPVLYWLFSWLPPVADKRLRRARLFLKQVWPAHWSALEWRRVAQVEPLLEQRLAESARELGVRVRLLRRGEELLAMEQAALAEWRVALEPLGVSGEAESLSLAECDGIADTRIRFPAFLLTTHYWEGRWLLEMREILPDLEKERRRTGRRAVEPRWRRRMKLTPCVVSTLFMLPKEMKVRRREDGGFIDDYLYDFADLLIVDEAGQVLPQVAGASFSLCRKALVIGDTEQIEPIWSTPVPVDIGNLLQAGLLPSRDREQAYERLTESGRSVASGSVMRIAQEASRYHYDPELARGMFLYEHRRCFDPIIDYCNVLCYRRKLIPKRGAKPLPDQGGDPLPALGYLHIEGQCRRSGGSRRNLLEAETVAAWIAARGSELESRYGKRLHEIVGVVTPFGGQVAAIRQACAERGIAVGGGEGEMTVGTVHSLQGAERPVVIFSPVYSKHEDGGFIDRRRSMLNVAVSRAKDSFLVFGDMDLFDSVSKHKPRGLLAKHLFRERANALHFECGP